MFWSSTSYFRFCLPQIEGLFKYIIRKKIYSITLGNNWSYHTAPEALTHRDGIIHLEGVTLDWVLCLLLTTSVTAFRDSTTRQRISLNLHSDSIRLVLQLRLLSKQWCTCQSDSLCPLSEQTFECRGKGNLTAADG